MPFFRKKPVTISAVQLPESAYVGYISEPWLEDAISVGRAAWGEGGLVIQTLEGEHLGRWGDWVIQGVQGEIYPCKPDIFEQTYERCPVAGNP